MASVSLNRINCQPQRYCQFTKWAATTNKTRPVLAQARQQKLTNQFLFITLNGLSWVADLREAKGKGAQMKLEHWHIGICAMDQRAHSHKCLAQTQCNHQHTINAHKEHAEMTDAGKRLEKLFGHCMLDVGFAEIRQDFFDMSNTKIWNKCQLWATYQLHEQGNCMYGIDNKHKFTPSINNKTLQ